MQRIVSIRRPFLLSLMMIWLSYWVYGQHAPVKAVKRGDIIPEFKVLMHQGSAQAIGSLQDFKGKLILLDFWNIHCLDCVAGMSHMRELQQHFNGKLQVILVTPDSEADVDRFWQKMASKKGKILADSYKSLLSVTADTILDKLFPHTGFPIHAWIDSSQHYLYSTYLGTTTARNIESIIRSGKADMEVQQVKNINFSNPFTWIDAGDPASLPTSYSLFFKGIEYGSGDGARIDELIDSATGRLVGIIALNATIVDLYRYAFHRQLPNLTYDRVVTRVSDRERLIPPEGEEARNAWRLQNTFCYALRVPIEQSADVYRIMLQELNMHYSLQASVADKTLVICDNINK